jgi:hypothetical protein
LRQGGTPEEPQPQYISALILLDRTVDPLTPMCTPLTYEGAPPPLQLPPLDSRIARLRFSHACVSGLVDEVFGIKNSKIDVDEVIINPAKVRRVCRIVRVVPCVSCVM